MRTPPLPQHMAEKEEIEHLEKLPEVSLLFSNYEKAVNNNNPAELKTKYSKGTVIGIAIRNFGILCVRYVCSGAR